MNPYSYVNGNPETWTDPTGERVWCGSGGCGGSGGSGSGNLGDGSDGGSGNGNNNNNNNNNHNSGGGCPWYDLGCNAQHIWHQVTHAFNEGVHIVKHDLNTAMHFGQQLEEVVVHSISTIVAVIAVAAAIIIGLAALLSFTNLRHQIGLFC